MKERGNSTCVPKASRCILTERAQIAVTRKAAGAAPPGSTCGLVFVPTSGIPATGSSFRAGEAQDAGLFGFVREIVDILAIFPQGHPLVVVTTRIAIADPVGIANEKRADFLLLTEGNHLAGSFVAQIADTAFCSCFDLVLGSLQFSPSARVLLASGLLLRNLA